MRSIAGELLQYIAANTGFEVWMSRRDQVEGVAAGPQVVIVKRERIPADDFDTTGETGTERISIVVLHETDLQAEQAAATVLAEIEDYAGEFVEGGRTVLAVYVDDQHGELPEQLADEALDWDVEVIELLIQHEAGA